MASEALQWRQALVHAEGLEKVVAFGADIVYKIASRVETTHQLHLGFVGPNQLPVGTRVSLGVSVQELERRFWIHPRPLGQTRAIVEWKEQGSERTFIEDTKLELPL